MASGKTLQSTIELSGVLSPSLQATIDKAVGELSKMSQETFDSADAATKLVAEMYAQEDILKTLKRAYAGYVASGEESSDTARELAGKIQDVSEELNQNRGTLRDAEKAADSLGDAMEDAGDKAAASSEGYTVLKNVIANLATEAIHAAVEGFKELVIEGDAALGMLEARTGATSKEMEGFEDVLYEVYNSNYGESLGDVSEKLSTIIQMTDDLDNASLAKVTKNAIALEDVFGFDTMESMRAVNSLMDQFGITSDQAFNLLVQGAQNGLNQNDDLLDTINEYSVQFKNAGYSADDMFNMLANGTETGTWSVDKLGDAVKEFNIRMSDGTANDYLEELGVDVDKVMKQFNKGGPDAQKAINTVMDAVMECDDATLQYQTGVGLFGTMWEDLGADAVNSLMSTEGAIKGTNDAMAQMDSAAYDTLESSVSQLGRTIKADVLQPIAESLTPALKGIVDWTTNNLPVVGVVIGGVTAAMTAFKIASISAKLATEGFTIATKLQSIAQGALNAVMNANPIGLIILGITALVAAFMVLWNKSEGFRNFWIGLWDGIKNAVSVAVDWIKVCWDKIKAFFTGDNIIAQYFQMGWKNIKIVWDVVVSYFKTIWENIKLVFSAVKSVLSGDFKGAWDAIKQIFANWGSFFSNLWNSVKRIFSNVASFFSGVFTKAKNGIASAFSNVYEKLTAPFQRARDAIKGIADKVRGFFKGAISMPRVKLPHFGISPKGWKIGDLLKGSIPKLSISWYKDGGILTGPTIFGASGGNLLGGGEAGAEAVLPLSVLWDKMERLIRTVFNSMSSTGEPSSGGLTNKAGQLLTLDNFSLGSLADNTSVVIYYDFSNFTWSPQIHAEGDTDEDDFMARLKAHEAEFFEWLEEFIQMREGTRYA